MASQLEACKVCTEENKRLRALAKTMAEELAKWGWGDMHYGPQPQERSVVAVLEEYRRVLRIDDACDCPCHQSVQPGLVPCPRCDHHSSRYERGEE